MIIAAPNKQTRQDLLGKMLCSVQEKLITEIENRYVLEKVWHTGGKKWTYEVKFRRGSRTVCSLLYNEKMLGFMVIFGKQEQMKFETQRDEFSPVIVAGYDAATAYHDGKWLLFELREDLLTDFIRLLQIKRRPDK